MTRGGSRNFSWFFGFLKCSWRLYENEENSKMLLCGSATDYFSSRICLIVLVYIRVFPFLLFCTTSSPSTPISTIYRSASIRTGYFEVPPWNTPYACEIQSFPLKFHDFLLLDSNFHLKQNLADWNFSPPVPPSRGHLHTLEIPHMPLFNNCRSTTEI